MDFGTFTIKTSIMHHVPRKARQGDPSSLVTLSEAVITLTTLDAAYLERRIKTTLGGYARPVIEDSSLGSPTPTLAKELIGGAESLVAHSQVIANTLHQSQPWMSPEGLLLVCQGSLSGANCVLIAKVEHEEGVRVEQTRNADNKLTYKAEYLRDLIFGEGTEVFKVGIFSQVADDGRLTGYVVDDQQGRHGVAGFFLNDVLGCQFLERPDVNTQTFFKTAEKWIASLNDPEKSARYEVALIAELQSTKVNLNVGSFARNHLDPEDRDSFIVEAAKAGVSASPIYKDVTLVLSQIKRVKVQTLRNASVFAPPEMLDDGSFSIVTNELTKISEIVIRDEVKSISGASGTPKKNPSDKEKKDSADKKKKNPSGKAKKNPSG